MRVVRLCLVALAGAATIVVVPFALAGGASPTPGAVLTVSTTADAVNGDVSSPAALVADPGPDGISLREAITAANHATGYEAITFAGPLAGQTITPATSLPAFTRDDTALIGSTTADGQPAVTLDAADATCCSGLFVVSASDVSISHLRIVGVRGDGVAVAVRAGELDGESAVHDVRIESNVLDNAGALGFGLWVGTDFPGYVNGVKYAGAAGASVRDVTVAHNVIRGFTDDGINVGLPGTQCSIQNLLIEDNTFADITGPGSPAVELDSNYTGNSIAGTRILRNSFTGNWAGIHLNGGVGGTMDATPTTGNEITGTVISQNVFDGNQQAIAFNAGAGMNATGNAVLDTEISDNVFVRNAPYGAIGIDGGSGPGVSGNRVDGVQIVNDTIAFNDGGISIRVDGAGNALANVEAQNTIFWLNGYDVGGPDATSAAPTIVTSLMGVDPRFVSAQDTHLQAGSPAIDAGTSSGAPAFDLEDRARVGGPDIGAYEFGAAPRPRVDVLLEELGGIGTVTSTPPGISCGTSCDAAFDSQTPVTLAAAPADGSVFAGWSGACSGTGSCTLTLAAAATVSATFAPVAVAPTTTTPKPKLAPKCKKGQKTTKKKPCAVQRRKRS